TPPLWLISNRLHPSVTMAPAQLFFLVCVMNPASTETRSGACITPRLSPAILPPDHDGEPGGDHKRDTAQPHRDPRTVERDLPLQDEAKELQEGDQHEHDDRDACERP